MYVDLVPPLREISFFGGTFTIPPWVLARPAAVGVGTKKKVPSVSSTNGVKASKQGHWTERVAQRKKQNQVKSLEEELESLLLEQISNIPVGETIYTKDTEFDAESWVGIAWKALLQPREAEP